MGLLGLYMEKVTRVRKKLIGSKVFVKLVRPLVSSDPACAENRVIHSIKLERCVISLTSQPEYKKTVKF